MASKKPPQEMLDAMMRSKVGLCPVWCEETRGGLHLHNVLDAVPDGWSKHDGQWIETGDIELDLEGTLRERFAARVAAMRTQVERLLELAEAMETDDGETIFAGGHVDPRRFILSAFLNIAANESLGDANRFLDEADAEQVAHVWWRYDRLPDDDEHMALCGENDEGALPFTMMARPL